MVNYQVVRETHWHQFSHPYQEEMVSALSDPATPFYAYVRDNQATERMISQRLGEMKRSDKDFNLWVFAEMFPPRKASRFGGSSVVETHEAPNQWIALHKEDKELVLTRIEEIYQNYIAKKAAQSADSGKYTRRDGSADPKSPAQLSSLAAARVKT